MDESLRPKIHNYNHKPYGRTKSNNAPCRKHPKHLQSPGVCSLCLNQKLSKLSNTCRTKRAANSSPSSSSSSYISSLSSSDASSYNSSPPAVTYRASKSTRVAQETLKKSRSMVFFLQTRRRNHQDNDEINNIGKTKRGFWSRLLFLPRKNNKALTMMHSRTTRERVIAAVQ